MFAVVSLKMMVSPLAPSCQVHVADLETQARDAFVEGASSGKLEASAWAIASSFLCSQPLIST